MGVGRVSVSVCVVGRWGGEWVMGGGGVGAKLARAGWRGVWVACAPQGCTIEPHLSLRMCSCAYFSPARGFQASCHSKPRCLAARPPPSPSPPWEMSCSARRQMRCRPRHVPTPCALTTCTSGSLSIPGLLILPTRRARDGISRRECLLLSRRTIAVRRAGEQRRRERAALRCEGGVFRGGSSID